MSTTTTIDYRAYGYPPAGPSGMPVPDIRDDHGRPYPANQPVTDQHGVLRRCARDQRGWPILPVDPGRIPREDTAAMVAWTIVRDSQRMDAERDAIFARLRAELVAVLAQPEDERRESDTIRRYHRASSGTYGWQAVAADPCPLGPDEERHPIRIYDFQVDEQTWLRWGTRGPGETFLARANRSTI